MAKQIFELFGKPLGDQSVEAIQLRHQAFCPFTNTMCDGGGNRHQTTIQLSEESPELQAFFNNRESVIPGVCSIQSEVETWLVCPRRLFGIREFNKSLLVHERMALEAMDLPKEQKLGIWSEVNINVRDEDSNFNYHFDFVISPFEEVAIEEVELLFFDDKDFRRQLRLQTKNGKLIIPSLTPLAIVEVMTASTSGSNTKKGTDIASAFKKSILGLPHTAPGINKRQVWGRMATQLFAKSACAEAWQGKTFWWLQDQFLAEIENTTQLSSKQINTNTQMKHNNVNLILFNVDSITGETQFHSSINGLAGLPYSGINNTFTGILLPK